MPVSKNGCLKNNGKKKKEQRWSLSLMNTYFVGKTDINQITVQVNMSGDVLSDQIYYETMENLVLWGRVSVFL